jgi:hypothetical protein
VRGEDSAVASLHVDCHTIRARRLSKQCDGAAYGWAGSGEPSARAAEMIQDR